jgi:hypothetical protein
VRYEGVAANTTREVNRTAFMSARAQPEPVEFDVMWDATTPMWSIGGEAPEDAESHTIWHMHLEQAGVVRSHIRFRGELITIDGVGYRDHSVGPRDLSGGSHHTWMQASFPRSKRHFGVISLAFDRAGSDGQAHTNAFAYADGKLSDTPMPVFPSWPNGEHLYKPEGFDVEVADPDGGAPVKFTGTLLDPSFYFTVDAPSEIVLGYESGEPSGLWSCREVLCRYDLDGEVGYGFLEISRRHE